MGSVPTGATDKELLAFFNKVLMATGCSTAPGAPVMHAFVDGQRRFAFVEMRTAVEANNALALDGIVMRGVPLPLRRPSDYNPVEVWHSRWS